MSLALRRLFTASIRAPWRSLQLVVGVAVVFWAGWALLGVFRLERHQEPAGAGVLRVTGVQVAESGDQRSLGPDDLSLLRGALPELELGGAVGFEVSDLAPPLYPVDELVVVAADPAWLALAGLELSGGRSFSELDALTAAPVCLLSSRMAAALGAGASPVGRHLRADAVWLTVVGQLADAEGGVGVPDITVPLQTGLLRMAPPGETALDQVLVGAPSTDLTTAALVERVLVQAHGGQVGWSIEGGRTGDALLSSLRRTLLVALGLLILTGLALVGSALEQLLGLVVEPQLGEQ